MMDCQSCREPDLFERFGLVLTDEQKQTIANIADNAMVASRGQFGLIELLYFLSTSSLPDHSNLNCLCDLEWEVE